MFNAASWCDQLIKSILGSQTVTAQPWETGGDGGRVEVLSPRDICSCHLLWDIPLCCRFVGLGAWARLSRGGVKKCRRNSPQLAPHPVALRGRCWGECLRAGALQEKLLQGLWAMLAEQQDAFHGTKTLEGLLKEV